jgi:hypothetical protein
LLKENNSAENFTPRLIQGFTTFGTTLREDATPRLIRLTNIMAVVALVCVKSGAKVFQHFTNGLLKMVITQMRQRANAQ